MQLSTIKLLNMKITVKIDTNPFKELDFGASDANSSVEPDGLFALLQELNGLDNPTRSEPTAPVKDTMKPLLTNGSGISNTLFGKKSK